MSDSIVYIFFWGCHAKSEKILTFLTDMILSAYESMLYSKGHIWLLPLLLTGCQTALDLPKLADTEKPVRIAPDIDQRRLAFTGGLFDLKRGDLYVAYPYWHWSVPNVNVGFYVCNSTLNYRFTRSLGYWNEDDNIFGSWPTETGTHIEKALADRGYNIKQHRQSFFADRENRPRAELLLSLRVTNMTFNMCYVHSPFTLTSLNRSGGEGIVTAEWEVYDTIREKILGSYTTQGFGRIDEPQPAGDKAVFIAAVRDAATRLADSDWLYRIMTTEDPVDLIPKTVYEPLILSTRTRTYNTAIRQHFTTARKAIISIRSEKDYRGSGFFINNEGYALTTARIVGDASFVQITDVNGTKYRARVLRRDERRDVALIKADIKDNFALPISDSDLPDFVETVYAVGTPRLNNYRATITKGIVAAHRFHVHQGLNFIQASIPTAAGYDGGPLTDEYGNVIGLTASIATDSSETNFSLFIPIHDALQALNVQISLENFRQSR